MSMRACFSPIALDAAVSSRAFSLSLLPGVLLFMRRLFLIAALCTVPLLLAGCSGSGVSSASNADPLAFQRAVMPSFPVYDADGRRLHHAFYGGVNIPRPEFADIDGDGDSDLFLQEQSGQLAFFENVAAGDSTRLVWRTDRFQDLTFGEWFRFVDLDQDGDLDLLAERPYSYIRVFENTGDSGAPTFALATDSLRLEDGSPIFSDRQNIPNVTDLDCDGALDLFLGRLDGTITRYEATTSETGVLPRFKKVTDNFEGIEIVNQQMASLHGANTLAFADVDADGDKDLFWGDFFEPGLLLIENTGSCASPNLRNRPEPFPPANPLRTSGYNAPTLVDWTGNGQLDLFVGVLGGAFDPNTTLRRNFHFFAHTDAGFEHRSSQFLSTLDVGSETATAWADLDGDGDLDGLVANKIDPDAGQTSRVYRIENVGTPRAPAYRLRAPLDLPDAYHYAPALGDLTGDGLPDLLLGSWKGRVAFYKSHADGTFALVSDAFVELPRGSNAAPALGDLDGDGDLDLIVGESAGTLNYFRNEGSASEPAFRLETEAFADVDADSRSAPALHDSDGDGDLDLFVGSQSRGLHHAENTGSPQQPTFAPATALPVDAPRYVTPTVADLNADGRPDLVTGSRGGGLVFFRAQDFRAQGPTAE